MPVDWAKPDTGALDALQLVHRQLRFHTKRTAAHYSRRYNLNDTLTAEIILYAQDMLWYAQLGKWNTTPPEGLQVPSTWYAGAKALLALVQCGWDSERGTWWTPRERTRDQALADSLLIADFILMVRQLRRQSRSVVSVVFEVVADLCLGIDWEKRFTRAVQAVAPAKAG